MDIEKLLRAAKDAIDGAMEFYGVADDHDNPYIAFQIGAAWAYINAAMGLSKSTVLFWRRRRGLAANFKQGERARGAERDG